MTEREQATAAAAAFEASVEAKSTRLETPCGDGAMIWRRWGDSGDPLILVHGGHGSWRHWIRNVEFLSRNRTVYVPDLPGFGDSAMPPDGVLLPAYATIARDGIERLLGPVAKFDIAGFSFGGLVGCLLADAFGERVSNLIVVGSAGFGRPHPPPEPMKIWRKMTDPSDVADAHAHNLRVHMLADRAHVDALAVYLQGESARCTRLRRRPMGGYELLLAHLPTVKAHVHAIWGSRDVPAGPDIEKRVNLIGTLHPDSNATVVEGVGHWLPYEAADTFNPMVEEILSGVRA